MLTRLRNALLLFQLLCTLPAVAGDSTPGGRERFVGIVARLETAPFSENAAGDRAWALVFLDEADDIKVRINANLLGELLKSKAPREREIAGQFILAAGRFVIQHPDGAPSSPEQNIAAFESCLLVYRKAVESDAANKIEFFDLLIQKQREKTFEDYIKQLVLERKPAAKPEPNDD